MKCSHPFESLDEAVESGEALPERFQTGFAVAFAGEEAAEHGDPADDFADRGCFLGRLLFGQQPSGLPHRVVEHGIRRQIGMDSPQSHQMGQPPGDNEIDDQRDLQFLDMPQLQRLDPASVLEHT